MEEQVGKLWHDFITRRAATGHPEAAVGFHELAPLLGTLYRAAGGDPARVLGCADRRRLHTRLSWLQRLAGNERRFRVAWQDDEGLYLPERIDLFSRRELNRTLYFWLTAMAAQLPLRFDWFGDNQVATRTLLERYPGFEAPYREMVSAVLAQRRRLPIETEAEKRREQAIAHALQSPPALETTPVPEQKVHPVPLWIYPAIIPSCGVPEEDSPPSQSAAGRDVESVSVRKQAKRIDDKKKTDGLLVFLPESLFTWSERIEVDRSEDDTFDQDAAFIAENLEEITLGERRDGLASRLRIDLDLPSAEADDYPVGRGIRLPEWHYKRRHHLDGYCLLQPLLSREAVPTPLPAHLRPLVRRIKSQLDSVRLGRQRLRRQPFGEEINLDAWLEYRADPLLTMSGQHFFDRTERNQRDLSTLILADLSLSTDAAIDNDTRIIDVIRDALLLFAETLHTLGDPFAMYGFSSVRNKMVRYHILKNFNERHDDRTRGRIQILKPGFYTRLGAAIRQSTRILARQPSEQRLLLILSDGKPNDIDRYEGRYGVEDTRQAIREARAEGITPFCITVDAEANRYLPYLFGSCGYTVVHDTLRLPRVVPEIYLGLTQ